MTILSLQNHLDHLLLLASRQTPSASDSLNRLEAWVRIYTTLYGFVQINGLSASYGSCASYSRKADALFPLLVRQVSPACNVQASCRAIAAMFRLVSEAYLLYDEQKDSCNHRLVEQLMEACPPVSGQPLPAVVCRCLTDYFHPEAEVEDPWFQQLSETVRSWLSTLSLEGRWQGMDEEETLYRLDVMNRYSLLTSDTACRKAASRSWQSLLRRLCPDSMTVEKLPLHLLLQINDISGFGNACTLTEEVRILVGNEFRHRLPRLSVHSDLWLSCLSGAISYVCGGITRQGQARGRLG